MRIQHNITALNSYRQLNGNNNNVAKNLEKLSSGYKINKAGDDAAGLAVSEKMRAQIAGLEACQKNANDGISLIQTAEGALQEVHTMLNRMVTLATYSSNGTYSDKNRQEYQKEVDALTKEIDRIGQATNFNGTKLLNGKVTKTDPAGEGKETKLTLTLQIGETADPFNKIAVGVSAMNSQSLKIKTIGVSTIDKAATAISNINSAIDFVSSVRSDLGALQNRLEHTLNNLGVQHENITAAESRIRDTDMAEEMMKFTKNNILVQAAQSMLAQANMVPQSVLQLLQ